MQFILKVLLNAGFIYLLANQVPSIRVKSFASTIWLWLLIGLLNATIGLLFRFSMNLMTLFLLTFLVNLVVTAVMIKLAARLYKGVQVNNWSAAFILAIGFSVIEYFLEKILD